MGSLRTPRVQLPVIIYRVKVGFGNAEGRKRPASRTAAATITRASWQWQWQDQAADKQPNEEGPLMLMRPHLIDTCFSCE